MQSHRLTLWSLIRGQRARYLGAVVAMLAAHVCLFGVPLVPAAAIDSALDGGDAGALQRLARALVGRSDAAAVLWTAAATIFALTALGGLFQYARGRLGATAAEAVVRGLRERVYAHLQRLPVGWHDRSETGDLVQRCTSDVDTLRAFLTVQVVQIVETTAMVALIAPVLFALSVPMALVSLALLPVILAFALVFFRRIQTTFRAVEEAEGRMTTVLQENLTGVRVVRAFARGDHERAKFAGCNVEYRELQRELIHVLGRFWSTSDFVCFLQLALVVFCGAWWTMHGELTVGTWFAFMTYEAMVLWPVRQLGRVLSETGRAMVALARIGEVLAAAPEGRHELEASASATDAGELSLFPRPHSLRGAIDVDGVRFAYGDGAPVLDGIDMTIRPGETVALVGPPGSGKSTLIALLLRLHDYEHGMIRLDGFPLTSLDRAFVRSQVGVVLQEPFLYSKTIAANLAVGREGAANDELVHAASEACVHEAIHGFDEGYSTLVGERGVTLSGGQRQRIALARALLKDPPVLILDDALSAVDTGTEDAILESLARRRGETTTILVAHRLSTLRDADRVFVFAEGRIVQAGSHAELSDREGPYRRLARLQGALEDELARDLAGSGSSERAASAASEGTTQA